MYTLKVVSDLAPDKLENIETDYPSLVGKNAKIFRRPKELCNEYYYESNLSASHIYNFCKQLVNVMELSEDEWKTEVTNQNRMLIAQRNIDIGMFYIILCEQMKYFGIDNKILTPYTTPHIIQIGGITNVKMG